MKTKTFSFIDISDVHLGHPNTPTEHIIKNLENEFSTSVMMEEIDAFFISGDMFDRLLNFPDNNVDIIESWINLFLRRCKKLDIVVRVLEGTPSHDWKQSKVFEKINTNGNIGCDVKHVTTLSIEHIDKFNKSFLYVPDEWEPEPDDTWKQVKDLLSINGIDKVDFAIMHGSFPHQLPPHIKVPMHDPNRYLSIVKYIVVIGHIHKPSVHERIYTPGSFDRISHGEEEPKGYIRFNLFSDDTWNVEFIENVNSKKYKTISCLNISIEEALEKIDLIIKELPKESFIRIEADKEDAIIVSLDLLKKKYPDYIWSSKISVKKSDGKELLVDMRAKYKTVDINKDNIFNLLFDRIINKNIDSTIKDKCKILLNEVIEKC